jgi:hypothetical protein
MVEHQTVNLDRKTAARTALPMRSVKRRAAGGYFLNKE